jgi:probable phosphoglycerate mutase
MFARWLIRLFCMFFIKDGRDCMTEILLIRHGETDWNVERRLQGHLDIELNAEGVRQAAALGEVLRGEALDAIFSSDMRRAQQTAQPIAASRGMEIQIEPALRERCYGVFEGLRHAEIGERYPDAYAAMRARDMDVRFPPGVNVAETLREFFVRSVGVITRLAQRSMREFQSGKIVIVTHGGVLDCLNRAARGLDFSRPRDVEIPNAGINRLRWDGVSMQICQWADIAHLSSGARDEIGE